MSKLAIHGGPKVREHLFPSQNTYDEAEMDAVERVMAEGRLSWYRGNWGPHFYGGPEIKALESAWQARFNVKHAICCNSATSGLHIALGVLGIKPKDQVIVTPWSMTCSATMPLAWSAEPVFADIEMDYFCLDYESVKKRIVPGRTKAILVVSLFGQPFDPRLREFGVPIIEDAAQAVGSWYMSQGKPFESQIHKFEDGELLESKEVIEVSREIKYAGTLGDIGVYSFNYGKHLNCGEGGMIVTDKDDLAMRCRLIMNHAESVVSDGWEQGAKVITRHAYSDLTTMFGFNLRMTEIQAAIVSAQLEKFDNLLEQRLENVAFLQNHLAEIPAITIPPVRDNCTHTYYVLPFIWDKEQADGLHRDQYIEAVAAELTPRAHRDGEGIPIGCGYIKPIYLMPIFQSRQGVFYGQGFCPNVESLWRDKLFLTLYHAPNSTVGDMEDVVRAFVKVFKHRKELLEPRTKASER